MNFQYLSVLIATMLNVSQCVNVCVKISFLTPQVLVGKKNSREQKTSLLNSSSSLYSVCNKRSLRNGEGAKVKHREH